MNKDRWRISGGNGWCATMNVSKESLDLIAKRKEELKRVIPEVFAEGKLDVNKLKQSLGEEVETSSERYSFLWAGKSKGIRLRDKCSKATLVPYREESVDFEETGNVFVEGDNLEVLKILQKAYQGKIKMIYIDPPYNTGKDFVYKDDFSDSLKNYLKYTGQTNGNGEKTSTNLETSGRYHSNWLTMIYPRLFIARNLLEQNGLIFVSIDDNEIHNLRMIMNEIFGEENFISEIVWHSKYTVANDTRYLSQQHEYVLLYAKNKESIDKLRLPRTEEMNDRYTNPDNDSRGPWKPTPLHAKSGKGESYTYTFKNGVSWKAPVGRYPRFSIETLKKLDQENRIWCGKKNESTPSVKTFLNELSDERVSGDLWPYEEVGHTHYSNEELADLLGKGVFDNPKPTKLVFKMLQLATNTDNHNIVLDFFAGSGTTAQSVLEQNMADGGNRKFILVQLPEPTAKDSEARKSGYKTIADICKERIRRAIKKLKETGKPQKIEGNGKQDLGFKVFKLSKSNCFVWDEEEASDPNTLARHIEESSKGAAKAEPDALLYEIMLKEGFALDSKIEKSKHGKNEFYQVAENGHRLFACFDDKLDEDSVKKLNREKDDKLVVLDSALSDTQKVNLARKMSIKTV